MKLSDIFSAKRPTISVEFFPPKTASITQAFLQTLEVLRRFSIDYVSMTYGAGGFTADRTFESIETVQQYLSVPVLCHLTCGAATKADVIDRIHKCKALGLQNILALRGDVVAPPSQDVQVDFSHAGDLVAFMKQRFPEFCVGVAGFPEGHPDTPNRLMEMEYLRWKVDQGAEYVVSQLFFDNRDFLDFRDRALLAGISLPIVAGLMIPSTRSSLSRIAELAAGARIPAKLLEAVQGASHDDEVKKIGMEWVLTQARDLIESHGVSGIHWYILNRPDLCEELMEEIC